MASRSLPSLSSACVFCRSVFEYPQIFAQTRFASSRRRKNENIVVQLIQDVPKWGASGTFVPVARGFMRNSLYRSRQARYVVGEELKQLLKSDTPVRRDALFGKNQERNDFFQREISSEVGEYLETESRKLLSRRPDASPEKLLELLGRIIPSPLIFHRKVNMTTKDIQVQGDVLSLPAGTPIFGSVTQTDVMQAIKEAIAHNQVAANIKFDERGVKMEQSTDGKLKHLGLYDISVPLLMQSSPLLSMKVDVRPSLGKERPQIE